MGTTRRGALIAAVGLAAFPGCSVLDSSGLPAQSSTEMTSTVPTSSETTPSEPPETASPSAETSLNQAVDILIYERDGQFRAIDGDDVIASHSNDLGRVINDAQVALSDGRLLVAAEGLVSTEIGLEDNVTISGIGRRTTLSPAEETDSSFNVCHTTSGPDTGRFQSLLIDMQNRGGSAIRAEGYADVVFDDIWVRNTAKNGLFLSDGRNAQVRNCRFKDVGDDAIRLVHSSDVTIHNCTSIGANYGIFARNSSDIVIQDYISRTTHLNGVALYDYTENWKVIGCKAVGDGHTPFAASPALNGSFIDCIAEGTTADQEGGFEIEYKTGHDSGNRKEPVVGCSVVSCTAIDCNMGFYAREDTSEETTNTNVLRPEFIDCTAVGCETGLFIDDNVVEATIRDFTAIDCTTDIVDNGTRTIIDDRSDNAGDPAVEGQWNGHAHTAAELNVTIEDTMNDTLYTATETGTWQQRT